MEKATFAIGDATFALTVVGTLAGGSFLWSWANDSLPSAAKGNIAAVRQFGIENDLMRSEPAMHAGWRMRRNA